MQDPQAKFRRIRSELIGKGYSEQLEPSDRDWDRMRPELCPTTPCRGKLRLRGFTKPHDYILFFVCSKCGEVWDDNMRLVP